MTAQKRGNMTFEELYEQFFVKVYNYARYRCANEQEAEDLSACIFAKIYKKFDTYNPQKAKPEIWVFTIAHSVMVDFFRRKKLRALFSFTEEQEETLTAPKDSPAESLEKTETEGQLKKALQLLSESEREIINLHYYQHLKQAEIAAIMKITQSNVGVILHRTVKKLKLNFGNEYEEK